MSVSRRHALKSGVALGAWVMIDRTGTAGVARRAEGAVAKAAAPLLTLEDYERAAKEKVDPVAWEYIASGAADEISVRWNMEAFRSIRLLPRMLREVSKLDTSVTLLGTRLAHPILLAPTACHKLAHPDGEVATARGARAAEAGMVLSTFTTVPVEQVAPEKPPVFWFQLYVQERAYTERLVRRVVAAGATAIAVTVDTPVGGPRNRQERAGFVFPTGLPHISVTRTDLPLTWKDLEWIQRAAGVPLFLKGVLHSDDADLGVKAARRGSWCRIMAGGISTRRSRRSMRCRPLSTRLRGSSRDSRRRGQTRHRRAQGARVWRERGDDRAAVRARSRGEWRGGRAGRRRDSAAGAGDGDDAVGVCEHCCHRSRYPRGGMSEDLTGVSGRQARCRSLLRCRRQRSDSGAARHRAERRRLAPGSGGDTTSSGLLDGVSGLADASPGALQNT